MRFQYREYRAFDDRIISEQSVEKYLEGINRSLIQGTEENQENLQS
jgi:hypothetical protein